MTVGDLGRRMSSSELTDWMALAKVEDKERQLSLRRQRAIAGLGKVRRMRKGS